MTNPLQTLLQAVIGEVSQFPPTSRYHGVPVAKIDGPRGPIAYLRRRFVPSPDRFAVIQEHTVVQGDRIDNLAAQYLGDPELYWRLADANNVINPSELTETIGRRILITLPEGVPGPTDA